MTDLDAVEARARQWLGDVHEAPIAPLRRQDVQTWAAVTHDRGLADRLDATRDPATVSPMYLVGQLQPGPWPWHDELRADGLAPKDAPGARSEDPVRVLHGGGEVTIHAPVHEGVAHRARREVVAVERLGAHGRQFLRVTVETAFSTVDGMPVADHTEHILLRQVPT